MHSWVTIAIPFDARQEAATRTQLQAMDNPASKVIRDALRPSLKIHFVSAGVISGYRSDLAHLVIEASSDLPTRETIELLASALGQWLDAAFAAAQVQGSAAEIMRRHVVTTGQGLVDRPGLDFTGTPGMSVKRIRDEWDLARAVRDLFDARHYPGSALDVRDGIRADIRANPKYTELWPLLTPEPTPLLNPPPADKSPIALGLGLAWPALVNFFWPILWLGTMAVIIAVIWVWERGLAISGLVFGAGLVLVFLALIAAAGLIYAGLVSREATDVPDDSLPDPAVLNAIADDENRTQQNHMTGVSIMKPGRLRRFTLRLAFWAIGNIAARQYRPGFLGTIGTIHFARWVVLPGTDRLLFFSNYGGSWESYLEDFVTKAHAGLTAVWSNTEGFPRASTLFGLGATDGDRFKRWARRQQQPTSFWYSAYPHVTTGRVRANAAIRQGLAAAATKEEAELWLAQLGSRTPPPSLLQTNEIPTLLFGGLKHHPYGACLLVRMPPDPAAARAWLAKIRPIVGFGDQPEPDSVAMLALGRGALDKVGLPESAIATFPFALRDGVASATRSKILEDTGDDQPAQWIWGAGPSEPDAALLVYASSNRNLRRAEKTIAAALKAEGGATIHRVALRTLGKKAQEKGAGRRNQEHEAFGFADGVSQPVIRGTRRWMLGRDELHSVEAGEFILGYPDDRGYLPLTPTVSAESDPANLLGTIAPAPPAGYPVDVDASHANLDRDLGRNGTYLVIRQLEQDVGLFKQSVEQVVHACAGHPGVPPDFATDKSKLREWVAAKIIGRWRDGTSLVRYPHRPGTGWDGKLSHVEPDNEFLLGEEDPGGLRCPFGAHIRRTNPRESFEPGSMEQLEISNRHRILRVGRPYPAYKRDDGKRVGEGLLFMCFNADIERQFEFIQQTWSMAPQFHGLENEVDGILGRGEKNGRLTIPTPAGPLQVKGLRDVVRVRGGGYFFVPSKSTLAYLSSLP